MFRWINPFQFGPDRYQPEQGFAHTGDDSVWTLQRRSAFFVGLIGVCLPLLLWASSVGSLPLHSSISHFYYAQFWGDVFVGALAFVGLYLLAYRGQCLAEARLATITGLCALGIALFPTTGLGCSDCIFDGRMLKEMTVGECDLQNATTCGITTSGSPAEASFNQYTRCIHLGFAASFMLLLAFHALFVFTRRSSEDRANETGSSNESVVAKHRRDVAYVWSGGTILVFIALYLVASFSGAQQRLGFNQLTFFLEMGMLLPFGFAWLVKGRFGLFGWLTYFNDPVDDCRAGLRKGHGTDVQSGMRPAE